MLIRRDDKQFAIENSLGCMCFGLLLFTTGLVGAYYLGAGWSTPLVLGFWPLYFWIERRWALKRVQSGLKSCGFVGALITSDSQKWQPYILEQWLPRFGGRLIIVNRSLGKRRSESYAPEAVASMEQLARLCDVRLDVGGHDCPVVILIGARGNPKVFHFLDAFKEKKRGNVAALRALEEKMLAALTGNFAP